MATDKSNKKIIPNPSKGRSLKDAMDATNKQYAGTLAKLAQNDGSKIVAMKTNNLIVTTLIDHPAIAADNTDAMAAWYVKVLGLQIHFVSGPNAPQTQKVYMVGPPAPTPAAGLAAGAMLEIMPRNDTPRQNRNSHEPGHSHIAWRVANLDAAHAYLQSHGVKFLSDILPAIGGGRVISFEDCEGNMIQVVERSGK